MLEFDWDPEKSDRNARERGFGFDVAARIFARSVIEFVDERFDYGEVRIRAVGETDGLVLSVIYTDRAEVRRIISAREASRNERQAWRG